MIIVTITIAMHDSNINDLRVRIADANIQLIATMNTILVSVLEEPFLKTAETNRLLTAIHEE
jgi:hypothetical protein